MKTNTTTSSQGFTLIELMVSSSIFVLVVVVAIGSLLLIHKSYKITEYKKHQLDTLAAVTEDMVRNIRIGRNINCNLSGDISLPADCFHNSGKDDDMSGLSIALEGPTGDINDTTDQIVYKIDLDSNNTYTLFKSKDGGQNFIRMIPEGIVLSAPNSGFTVLESTQSDGIQPFIKVRLVGTISYNGNDTPFVIQTSVTPRALES